MLRPFLLATALAFAALPAVAQEVPKDADACFDMSGALLEQAGDNIPDAKAAEIEKLVKNLEADCDAGKYADAAAKAKEVKALLGSK